MNDLNRRAFFSRSSLGFAAVALPDWLRLGFQLQDPLPQDQGVADRERALADTIERARGRGKPVLVLVVPEDERASWDRARSFGAILNNGPDELFLGLSLCEVACAQMDEVQRVVGKRPEGEPFMLLIKQPREANAASGIAALPDLIVIDADVDDLNETLRGGFSAQLFLIDLDTDDPDAANQPIRLRGEEELLELSIEIGKRLIEEAAGDEENFDRSLQQARRALSATRIGAINDWIDGAESIDEDLVSGGAVILYAAAKSAKDGQLRERIHRRLQAVTRRILSKEPVPGSKWATSSGCGGIRVEGGGRFGQSYGRCGMAHSHPLSERFLHFYSK